MRTSWETDLIKDLVEYNLILREILVSVISLTDDSAIVNYPFISDARLDYILL